MRVLSFFPLMLIVFFSFGQNPYLFNDSNVVFINELHYDNVGADTLEGLEIASLVGTDLSCYKIYLINGNNGNYYSSIILDSISFTESCGVEFRYYYKSSIQNGSSSEGDGVLLYNLCDNTIVQFVSYEGEITANNGPFVGAVSSDIGIAQNGDIIGTSLQLQGSLDSNFEWYSSVSSFGQINENQSFCQTKLGLNQLDLESSCVMTETENVSLQLKNNSYSNSTDSVVLFFQTNNSIIIVDTISQSLAEGDSLEFTFSSTLDLSQVGSYQFKVWAHSNSILISDTLFHSIELIDDDSIVIELEEYVIHCHNKDSLVLNAQVSGADYNWWNIADSTQQLIAFPSTDTSFYFIANNTCYSDTAWVNVAFVKPEFNFIGIDTYNEDTLYVEESGWVSNEVNTMHPHYNSSQVILSTIEKFDFYHYYFEDAYTGTIFESNDSIFNVTPLYGGSNNYDLVIRIFLEVIDSSGCLSSDSVVVYWTFTSINENTNFITSIFPNPNDGLFSVSLEAIEAQEEFSVELLSPLGHMVERQNIYSNNSQLYHSFDFRHLPQGLYYIHFKSEKRRAFKRLIIQ